MTLLHDIGDGKAVIIPEAKSLIGQNLANFKVELVTEVYRTNEDGRYSKSIAFFRDPNVAKAFAQHQVDASFTRTRELAAITNGKQAFILGEFALLENDEAETLKLRVKILDKFTTEERRILGI